MFAHAAKVLRFCFALAPPSRRIASAPAMSVIAAVARQARAPARCPAMMVSRRHLGEGVRGPPVTDFAANLRIAKEYFTTTPISYVQYKQQCMSLRMFAFAGVAGGCVLSLVLDPPRSSYWIRFG